MIRDDEWYERYAREVVELLYELRDGMTSIDRSIFDRQEPYARLVRDGYLSAEEERGGRSVKLTVTDKGHAFAKNYRARTGESLFGPLRHDSNRAGNGYDVFGRNETIVQFDDGPGFAKAISSGEMDEVTDEKIAEVRLSPGSRAMAFAKASPKMLPDEKDGPIILALEAAPLPLGYISNGLLYSNSIDRLPARTKARLYRLVKGGHVRVVRTWRPVPQYWLISNGTGRT